MPKPIPSRLTKNKGSSVKKVKKTAIIVKKVRIIANF